MHRASSILKQVGIPSPDGTKVRAVKSVMKLIAHSLSAAKLAYIKEAGPDISVLLSTGNECDPTLSCTKAKSPVMLIGSS